MSLFAYPILFEKLHDAEYRKAFVAASVRNQIALQIRALRKSKFETQEALGDAAGKPANVISRLENPSYGKVRIQTLVELAQAFDVALIVKFATFGELAESIENTSDIALDVSSFEEEVREAVSYMPSNEAPSPVGPSAADLVHLASGKLGTAPSPSWPDSQVWKLGRFEPSGNAIPHLTS